MSSSGPGGKRVPGPPLTGTPGKAEKKKKRVRKSQSGGAPDAQRAMDPDEQKQFSDAQPSRDDESNSAPDEDEEESYTQEDQEEDASQQEHLAQQEDLTARIESMQEMMEQMRQQMALLVRAQGAQAPAVAAAPVAASHTTPTHSAQQQQPSFPTIPGVTVVPAGLMVGAPMGGSSQVSGTQGTVMGGVGALYGHGAKIDAPVRLTYAAASVPAKLEDWIYDFDL